MARTRILLVTLAGLATLSCGQAASPVNPSAPSALDALFRPGTYMLSIRGPDAIITETGIEPACPGISSVGIANVLVEVSLTLDQNAWRARQELRAGPSRFGSPPGRCSPVGPAGGYVMGELVFGNSAGARVLCNPGTVRWFLSILD